MVQALWIQLVLGYSSKMIAAQKALVLAPHPDDAELGAGGLIRQLHDQGSEVHVAVFSTTEEVYGTDHSKGLILEMRDSMSILGVRDENVHLNRFPTRNFSQVRQEILQWLIDLRNELHPDLIVGPNGRDIHQDHSVVHAESERAFKSHTRLGFDTYWNISEMQLNFFVEISEDTLLSKLEALGKYKSQNNRGYFRPDVVRAQATLRGSQSGLALAEAFTLHNAVFRFAQLGDANSRP